MDGFFSVFLFFFFFSEQNREKVKIAAQQACERLGKFRMPFAWTAIHIQDIVSSGVQASNSVFDHRRETATSRNDEARNVVKSVIERRQQDSLQTGLVFAPGRSGCASSESQDAITGPLSNFKPVTLTVNSFFRQVSC